MADEKISAMTPLTAMLNASIVPTVQSGANNSVTKQIFLTGGPGEDIGFLSSSGSACRMDAFGGTDSIVVTDGAGLILSSTTNLAFVSGAGGTPVQLGMDLSGNFQLTVDDSGSINLGSTTHLVFAFDPTADSIAIEASQVAISYAPGAPASWAGTPPIDVWEAIDRLAACFTTNSLIKP